MKHLSRREMVLFLKKVGSSPWSAWYPPSSPSQWSTRHRYPGSNPVISRVDKNILIFCHFTRKSESYDSKTRCCRYKWKPEENLSLERPKLSDVVQYFVIVYISIITIFITSLLHSCSDHTTEVTRYRILILATSIIHCSMITIHFISRCLLLEWSNNFWEAVGVSVGAGSGKVWVVMSWCDSEGGVLLHCQLLLPVSWHRSSTLTSPRRIILSLNTSHNSPFFLLVILTQ